MRTVFLAAALVACLASPSLAATLEVVGSTVAINKGSGFKPVTGIVDAQPGDRINVANGGSANVVYTDGCTIRLGEQAGRSALTVPATCKAGPVALSPPASSVLPGVVIGGVIAGGVILAISGSDSNKPTSP